MPPLTANELRYLSPLRYPGGKGRLAPIVSSLLKANNLVGGTYVEPYAGGAGVALALLFRGVVSEIVINDLDLGVYAFWHSALHETDSLCRLISKTRISMAEWQRQRLAHQDPTTDLLHRGFATFYLNRTNHSGIVCSGGVIGGRKQRGEWTLSARYNKEQLVRRIERIADRASSITVYNMDAVELFKRDAERLPSSTIWYLDPPYYVKGQRRLYANYYHHEDHANIATALIASSANWLVTYDDAAPIRALYRGCSMRRYRVSYSAHDSYYGEEVMCLSRTMKFPRRTRQSEGMQRSQTA